MDFGRDIWTWLISGISVSGRWPPAPPCEGSGPGTKKAAWRPRRMRLDAHQAPLNLPPPPLPMTARGQRLGSLAVSAASGHKSRVTRSLSPTTGSFKSLAPRNYPPLAGGDGVDPGATGWDDPRPALLRDTPLGLTPMTRLLCRAAMAPLLLTIGLAVVGCRSPYYSIRGAGIGALGVWALACSSATPSAARRGAPHRRRRRRARRRRRWHGARRHSAQNRAEIAMAMGRQVQAARRLRKR